MATDIMRKLTTGMNRISRGLNRWVEIFVCAMGMSMTVIVISQVFSRYLLNHSLFWSEELARYLLVWLTFFGASVAYYHKAHPGVDALYLRLPQVLRRGAAFLVHGVSFFLFIVMVVYGIQFAWFVRFQITPALSFPKWMIMSVVPLSGVIFMIHTLAFIAGDITSKKNKGEA